MKSPTISALRTIRTYLQDPTVWCQNAVSRDKNGKALPIDNEDGVSFCLSSIIRRVTKGDMITRRKLTRAITEEINKGGSKTKYRSIAQFNDDVSTHVETIRFMLANVCATMENDHAT